MPRSDIEGARSTEGRGAQTDAYGFLQDNRAMTSGRITPVNPNLQQGGIQFGDVVFGRSANQIQAGGNQSTQLANLLNTTVDATSNIVKGVKTIYESHDREEDRRLQAELDNRKTATKEELPEGQKPWGEMSEAEQAGELAEHYRKVKKSMWLKGSRLAAKQKATASRLMIPGLTADGLISDIVRERLEILSDTSLSEDEKSGALIDLMGRYETVLDDPDSQIAGNKKALDNVRTALYTGMIENENRVSIAVNEYLEEIAPDLDTRMNEFIDQALAGGLEDEFLNSPERFIEAFVEHMGPALQEPMIGNPEFAAAFAEKLGPKYAELLESRQETGLKVLRKRFVAKAQLDFSSTTDAAAGLIASEANTDRLSPPEIAERLEGLITPYVNTTLYSNSVDANLNQLAQQMAKLVMPIIQHAEGDPFIQEAAREAIDEVIKPFLIANQDTFNLSEEQLDNVLENINRYSAKARNEAGVDGNSVHTKITDKSPKNGGTRVETNLPKMMSSMRTGNEGEVDYTLGHARDTVDAAYIKATRRILFNSFTPQNGKSSAGLVVLSNLARLTKDPNNSTTHSVFINDISNIISNSETGFDNVDQLVDEVEAWFKENRMSSVPEDARFFSDDLKSDLKTILLDVSSNPTRVALDNLQSDLNPLGEDGAELSPAEQRQAFLDGRTRIIDQLTALSNDPDLHRNNGLVFGENGEIIITEMPTYEETMRKVMTAGGEAFDAYVRLIVPEIDLEGRLQPFEIADVIHPLLTGALQVDQAMRLVGVDSGARKNRFDAMVKQSITGVDRNYVDTAAVSEELNRYYAAVEDHITILNDDNASEEDRKIAQEAIEAATILSSDFVGKRLSEAALDVSSRRGFELSEIDEAWNSPVFEETGEKGKTAFAKVIAEKGPLGLATLRTGDGNALLAAYYEDLNGKIPTPATFGYFLSEHNLTLSIDETGETLTIVDNPEIKAPRQINLFNFGTSVDENRDGVVMTLSESFTDRRLLNQMADNIEIARSTNALSGRDANAARDLVSGLAKMNDPSTRGVPVARLRRVATEGNTESEQFKVRSQEVIDRVFDGNKDAFVLFRKLLRINSSDSLGNANLGFNLQELYNLDLRLQLINSSREINPPEFESNQKNLYDIDDYTPLWGVGAGSLENPRIRFDQDATGGARHTFVGQEGMGTGPEVKERTWSPLIFPPNMRSSNLVNRMGDAYGIAGTRIPYSERRDDPATRSTSAKIESQRVLLDSVVRNLPYTYAIKGMGGLLDYVADPYKGPAKQLAEDIRESDTVKAAQDAAHEAAESINESDFVESFKENADDFANWLRDLLGAK